MTSQLRLPQLPDVPTVAAGGLAGDDSNGWFGLVVPTGTPSAVINRLNAEFTAARHDEALRASLRAHGVEPAPSTPEAFGSCIAAETSKWAKVVRIARIELA